MSIETFASLTNLREGPKISHSLLDSISNFLIYGEQQEVLSRASEIIIYLTDCAHQFIEKNIVAGSDEEYILSRIFVALRQFRPSVFTQDLSKVLMSCCYKTARKALGVLKCIVPLLVDHISSSLSGSSSEYSNLFQLMSDFLRSASKNPLSSDFGTIIGVFDSFRIVTQQDMKNQREPQSYIDFFISMANNIMTNFDNSNFYPNIAIFVSRCLRAVFRLIEVCTTIPPSIFGELSQMSLKIGQDFKYLPIYQNHLLCCLFLINKTGNTSLMNYVKSQIKGGFQAILFPPISKNRRSTQITQLYFLQLSKSPNDYSMYSEIMPSFWPLLSSLNLSTTVLKPFYGKFLYQKEETAKNSPIIIIDIIDQIVSSIEINMLCFGHPPIEGLKFYEHWSEYSLYLVQLLQQYFMLDSHAEAQSLEPLRMQILKRLAKYLNFLMDLFGMVASQKELDFPIQMEIVKEVSLKEFRDKLTQSIHYLIDMISQFTLNIQSLLFFDNMMLLLPMKAHHVYFPYFHQKYTKKSPPFGYFYSLYHTFNHHYQELHSSVSSIIVESFAILYSENSQISNEQYAMLSNEVFQMMTRIILSENGNQIDDILIPLLHILFSIKGADLIRIADYLYSSIKKYSSLWQNILLKLSPELQMSRLAFYFYPICEDKEKNIEGWYKLFIPAIEKPNHCFPDFFQIFTSKLAPYFPQIRKPLQHSFVSALFKAYITLKDNNYAAIMLTHIVDQVYQLMAQLPKKKTLKLNTIISGIHISVDIVFASIKRIQNPSDSVIQLIINCLKNLVGQLPFFDSVSHETMNDIADFIAIKASNLFVPFHNEFNPPQKYAAIYFQKRILKSSVESIKDLDDILDFSKNVATLSYSRVSSEIGALLIEDILSNFKLISTYTKFLVSLVQAAQHCPNTVNRVLKNSIFSFKYSTEDELKTLNELTGICYGFAFSPYRQYQKFGLNGLKVFEKMSPPGSIFHNRLIGSFSNLYNTTMPAHILIKNKVYFVSSIEIFTTVDHNLLHQKFLKLIVANNTPPLQPDQYRLAKVHQDSSIFNHLAKYFCIKFVAWIISTEPNEKAAQSMFEKTMSQLEESQQGFIIYFLRKLEHFNNYWNRDFVFIPKKYFSEMPDMNSRKVLSNEDIELNKFLIKANAIINHDVLAKYVFIALSGISKNLSQNNRMMGREYLKSLYSLIKIIKCQNESRQLHGFILEFSIQLVLGQQHVSRPPLHIIVSGWQNLYPELFASLLAKTIRIPALNVFESLFLRPDLSDFRKKCIEILNQNLRSCLDCIKTSQLIVSQFVLNRAPYVLATAVKDNLINEQTILMLQKTVVSFIQYLPKDGESSFVQFKPAYFLSFLEILFPDKVEWNNEMFNFFISDSIILVLNQPLLFGHPTMQNRLLLLFQKFNYNNRQKALNALLSYSTSSIQCESIRFVFLSCLFKNLDITEKCNLNVKLLSSHAPLFYSSVYNHHYNYLKGLSQINIIGNDGFDEDTDTIYQSDMNQNMIYSLSRLIKRINNRSSIPQDEIEQIKRSSELFGEVLHRISYMQRHVLLVPNSNVFQTIIFRDNPRNVNIFISIINYIVYKDSRLSPINIRQIPQMVLSILDNVEKSKYYIFFDIFVVIFLNFLDSTMDNSNSESYKTLPPVLELVSQNTNVLLLNQENLIFLRKKLIEKTEQKHNVIKYSYLLQLIGSSAPVLFNHDSLKFFKEKFFPTALIPNIITHQQCTKDLIICYQGAISQCWKTGGSVFEKLWVQEFYMVYRNIVHQVLSPPCATAYSSLAKWISESRDKNQHQKMNYFLSVFKPNSDNQFLTELHSIEFPISLVLEDQLATLLTTQFSHLLPIIEGWPYSKLLIKYNDENSISHTCWSIKWDRIHGDTHAQVFARVILPQSFSTIIFYITQNELKDLLVLSLNNICIDSSLKRFIMYYCKVFSSTSLSYVFRATHLFSKSLPLYNESVYINSYFLDTMNFTEDSLGLIKTYYPHLTVAATYSQLCQYKAAQSHYFDQLSKDSSLYGISMVHLRFASLNTGFPQLLHIFPYVLLQKGDANNRRINQPFILYFNQPSDFSRFKQSVGFTSFFSSTLFVTLSRQSLIEETLSLHKQRSDHNQRSTASGFNSGFSEEKIKQWTNSWMGSLDRLGCTASVFASKIGFLEAIKSGDSANHIQTDKFVLESLEKNYFNISWFLFKCGSVSKSFSILRDSKVQTEYQCLPVNKVSLPKAHSFSWTNQTFISLKSQIFLFFKDYKNSIQMIHNQQNSPKEWVKMIVSIIQSFPHLVDGQSVLSRLYTLINNSSMKDSCYYIYILLSLLKDNPSLQNEFGKCVLSNNNTLSDQSLYSWIQLLPLVFSICEHIPPDLLKRLFVYNPSYFKSIYQQTQSINPKSFISIKEIISEFKDTKEMRHWNNFDGFFAWTKKCSKEIESYYNSCLHYQALLAYLIQNQNNGSITLGKAEKSIDEVLDYCQQNPPFFKTDTVIPEPNQSSGFVVPFASQITAFHIELNAPGDKEAFIAILSQKGEQHYYYMLLPHFYKYHFIEESFVNYLTMIIDSHPSAKGRPSMFYYPPSFLFDTSISDEHKITLAICNMPKFTTIHQMYPIKDIVLQLVDSRKNSHVDESPLSYKERKLVESPPSLLFNWFLNGSDGNYNDFLFMRNLFTSQFSAMVLLRFLFGSQYPVMPVFALTNDRFRFCLPGFFTSHDHSLYLPLTDQIEGFIPQFMMRGSFTTTWIMISEVINENSDNIRIVLRALLSDEMKEKVSLAINRAEIFSNNSGEYTEKSDTLYPSMILEHLISVSHNAFSSQDQGFAWI